MSSEIKLSYGLNLSSKCNATKVKVTTLNNFKNFVNLS